MEKSYCEIGRNIWVLFILHCTISIGVTCDGPTKLEMGLHLLILLNNFFCLVDR